MIPSGICGKANMNQSSEPAVSTRVQAVRAQDKQLVNAFIERIRVLSTIFSERETAYICRVSVEFIKKVRDQDDLKFQDPKRRTRTYANEIRRKIKTERAATYVREVNPPKPLKAHELLIPSKLRKQGFRNLVAREHAFHARVVQLSETMSFKESTKILGVSGRFLRNYIYEYEIVFAGYNDAPSTAGLDMFDLPFDDIYSSVDAADPVTLSHQQKVSVRDQAQA